MKFASKVVAASAVAALALVLGACGNNSSNAGKTDKAHSVALITDGSGVDDKSFNQAEWEGLVKWGKKNNMVKGVGGYNYAQSNSDADFTPNVNKMIQAGYKTIIGSGYKLEKTISDAAKKNPKTNFVIMDDEIKQSNIASVSFKDNESAFLAGVAAAMTTKTNKVGFIGGLRGEVISRFETGYRQGVAAVNKNIKVDVKYADSFSKADVGQALAQAMYNNNEDVIYQAAGGTGAGVFAAAKNAVKSKKVWVIGVDMDQTADGKYKGGNVTLTSTIKGVDIAVQKLATDAKKGKFPGGTTQYYGLKENGVRVTRGNMSAATWAKVKEYREKIVNGDIKVASKQSEL